MATHFHVHTQHVFFTAPTFITRLDGNASWDPAEEHDEYWHAHADMQNTAHYHFSGLLYLSTLTKDFTGGRLIFRNEVSGMDEVIVEPVAGRTVIFTSGKVTDVLFLSSLSFL